MKVIWMGFLAAWRDLSKIMARSSEKNSTSAYHLRQPVKSVAKKDFCFPKIIALVNKEGF